MIQYECYDNYGQLVFTHEASRQNYKTAILQKDGNYYRPIAYELGEVSIAKCVPVDVINCNAKGKSENA